MKQLEKEEKNKFSLIRPAPEQHIKLKAESQADAEEWMQKLSNIIKMVAFLNFSSDYCRLRGN